jgi:hypothetical protein
MGRDSDFGYLKVLFGHSEASHFLRPHSQGTCSCKPLKGCWEYGPTGPSTWAMSYISIHSKSNSSMNTLAPFICLGAISCKADQLRYFLSFKVTGGIR